MLLHVLTDDRDAHVRQTHRRLDKTRRILREPRRGEDYERHIVPLLIKAVGLRRNHPLTVGTQSGCDLGKNQDRRVAHYRTGGFEPHTFCTSAEWRERGFAG